MERKLTGTYNFFTILMQKIKYIFDFELLSNTIVPTDILQEYDSINKSKQKQFDEINREPEIIQLMEELNDQTDIFQPAPQTLPPEILSRKITLSMSEEFFNIWVVKAFDYLIKEKPLYKEIINEFYKENFGVDNKYT